MFITILLFILILFLTCHYYAQYISNQRLMNKIPGYVSYVIVNNLILGQDSLEELWKILINLADLYYPILKLWNFLVFLIFIRHPNDLEVMLKNSKHIEKGIFYDALHPFIGTSLFTSSKWQSRRRLLTPIFHFNALQQFTEILIEEGESMTNSLKNAGDTITKDLDPFISEHTLNAICEAVIGISPQGMSLFQHQYRKAVYRINEFIVYRFFRQWAHNNWIFSLTPKGREQTKILKLLHGFTEKIIEERKVYHKHNGQYLRNLIEGTVATDAKTIEIQKKRLAMLDFLIIASQKDLLTDSDIKEEVNGLIYKSHDTVAMGICFALSLLAEHKDIQDCARKEIDTIMQQNQGKLTMKSLQDLQYLERCIQETLRLYPSVLLMARITSEDTQLRYTFIKYFSESHLIPAGAMMILNIFKVHRDKNFWPNPEIFDPDRFLPENVQNRHLYSYIPFSAGPRKCIGQRFALLMMKAMIAPLIHNFYLEPVDYLKDVRMGINLICRPLDSHRIKFIPIATKSI
ncbi:cytochrome P450 4C1 isoform X2 [Solenopsis invicta]|uniref:cytochrome P450 4C1 isoform X2 n=1 Tax=Solenopsis invicta TaxID=13686 RepID=UPI00193D4D12|nr:cytochrome P450 4C1 isoform X2 [Solenopsis invicta]